MIILTLLEDFRDDERQADGESHYLHLSDLYRFTGIGDVNTYALFAELGYLLISLQGTVGVIIPTGIATDNTYQYFFAHLISEEKLVSLFDFENRGHLFSDLHTKTKFCLLTLSAHVTNVSRFCFMALDVEDLRNDEKVFELTSSDFDLLNPNTRTCPLFRTRRDAEL